MPAPRPFDLAKARVVTAPFQGAPQTVKSIIAAALGAQTQMGARGLAEKICRDLRSKDYLSEALAVYHFILGNTRYTRDPRTIELVKAPNRIIQQLAGGQRPLIDCDDMTTVLASLLLALGHPVRIVTAAFATQVFKGEQQYSHVFVQACEPKTRTWVTLDPVAGEHTRQMHAKIIHAKVYGLA